jgi:hypothetical protein
MIRISTTLLESRKTVKIVVGEKHFLTWQANRFYLANIPTIAIGLENESIFKVSENVFRALNSKDFSTFESFSVEELSQLINGLGIPLSSSKNIIPQSCKQMLQFRLRPI